MKTVFFVYNADMEKNPEELERVYRIGRQEAEKRLPEIRQWLTDDHQGGAV